MNNEHTQKLAERIAVFLQETEKGSGAGDDDFSFVRTSLEKINERLDKIESSLNSQQNHPSSFILHPSNNHPSREKFTDLEEIADEIINNLKNEKACPYEPSGKPCDHCAMCNSRGF